MSLPRLFEIFRLELRRNLTRPMFWILLGVVLLLSYGLAGGNVRIGSGDSTVGGTKAWITSEFALAQILSSIDFLVFIFFFAAMAGLPVLRDDEDQVLELLHSTPLTPGEYLWGKFLAVLSIYAFVVATHLGFSILFNHAGPAGADAEFLGPFALSNYLRPVLWFTAPAVLFTTSICFLLGTLTRKPILVFLLPVLVLIGCGFFLWTWSPSWLDPRLNQLLMMIDPAGFRWLNETYLKVDRGVEFYNTQSVPISAGFMVQRIVITLLGLLAVLFTQRQFSRSLRGASGRKLGTAVLPSRVGALPAAGFVHRARLSALSMTSGRVGYIAAMWEVARVEMRGLIRSPGLYLFVPICVLTVIENGVLRTGAFDTPLLLTSGSMAAGAVNWLVTLTCLLLLFYTVESLVRERTTGLSQIHYSTPVATSSYFFGKVLGSSVVALVMLGVSFLACAIAVLLQGKVALDISPFLIVWGALLLPTFLVWTALVTAIFTITKNRMTSYALGLVVLAITGYKQVATTDMTWVWNWTLYGAVVWTDLAPFELNGKALLLNRLLYLGMTIFLTALAVRCFPRREFDATRTLHRMRPAALARSGLLLLPFAAPSLILAGMLYAGIQDGFQGDAAEKAQKDYWRRNVATFTDSKVPDIVSVDVDLSLDPADSAFTSEGAFELMNHLDEPLRQIPVTPGPHWKEIRWSLDGEEFEPEDRAGLAVFNLKEPLAPGRKLTIGFSCSGRYPDGLTRNGGGTDTFILPSGAVLTSFSPQFTPVIGYMEGIGVDRDNSYDSREYADDFFEGLTHAAFGNDRPFATRIKIEGPASWTLNSVGTLVSDELLGERRAVVWQSDHPVSFFNVVAGPLVERKGEGTSIHYNPQHDYNIDEMLEALDGARRYYSDWFFPFPWKELKLTEFPALAGYAQGFPTNITFSEGIGFLTASDPKRNAAFLVTAHESAHQWWGNILVPGKGPGGNIIAEGLAHYSTMLLFQAIKGDFQRIEFMKGIEDQYGEQRQVDSERPLVKIDGTRPGDTTTTYDKGGWVFWMLQQQMGRDDLLSGLRAFISRYHLGPDHPVLQDIVAVLREFAPDAGAFDRFCEQWFFDVVVPEYRLGDARKHSLDDSRYQVSVTVHNAGTSHMPVEIAAWSGERFDDDGNPELGFQERRGTVLLGPDEKKTITLTCDFDPDRIVVDPDALVLQLKRELAAHQF
ncbi:MAG: ABC transporter permease subunit [Planctomycetota bacterium]